MKFTLPIPPGVNAMYRTWRGRMLISAKGRAYKTAAALSAKAQGVRALAGPVSVELRVYRARKAGDLDGFLKGLFDALNGIAWNDDSQVVEILASRLDDKANPRVEMRVEPFKGTP